MSSAPIYKPLAVIGFLGVVWWNGLLGSAWESFATHRARLAAEELRIERVRNAGYEENYRFLCPDYYAASFFDRHWTMRTFRWCEDFRDRFED